MYQTHFLHPNKKFFHPNKNKRFLDYIHISNYKQIKLNLSAWFNLNI